jgi:hypothetical protein
MTELYLHAPIHLHGILFNELSTGATLLKDLVTEIQLRLFRREQILSFSVLLHR